MPITLKPPVKGRSKFYRVRGTYLGVRVDRTTETTEERAAKVILKRWKEEIERGTYSHGIPRAETVKRPATFGDAAIAYIDAGGERAFLGPIIELNGPMGLRDKALTEIDQISIDRCAAMLYPKATAATKNRQVYTPVSAVLKRAGIEKRILRPAGWRGRKSVSWLTPEQAFALFAAADQHSAEFGLFLKLLCYTGMRLGEAINIKIGDIDISNAIIYLPQTKNGDARTVYLTKDLVAALANHPRGLDRPKHSRLIRFHVGGRIRTMLAEAMEAAGLSFPRRQRGFHLFRHTWATWMRRYGGLDTSALLETGAWRDRSSAARYEHLDVTEEARKADLLPTPSRASGGRQGGQNG